jgi:anti-sigma regulatory factor (Ser/Thr protein kinase)
MPAYPTTLSRLRQTLGRWLDGHEIDREVAVEITIAVSEACANAIEHAYGPGRGSFTIRAERTAAEVTVRVSDHGSWRPPRGEHRGRGLKIMQAAMDSLDVRSDKQGTDIVMSRALNTR